MFGWDKIQSFHVGLGQNSKFSSLVGTKFKVFKFAWDKHYQERCFWQERFISSCYHFKTVIVKPKYIYKLYKSNVGVGDIYKRLKTIQMV